MTNAEAWFNVAFRPQKPQGSLGRKARDGHLDFHTVPVKSEKLGFESLCFCPECKLGKQSIHERETLISQSAAKPEVPRDWWRGRSISGLSRTTPEAVWPLVTN